MKTLTQNCKNPIILQTSKIPVNDWFEHRRMCLQLCFLPATYPVNSVSSVMVSMSKFYVFDKTTLAMITEVVFFPIFIATIVNKINSFNTIMQLINPYYP